MLSFVYTIPKLPRPDRAPRHQHPQRNVTYPGKTKKQEAIKMKPQSKRSKRIVKVYWTLVTTAGGVGLA